MTITRSAVNTKLVKKFEKEATQIQTELIFRQTEYQRLCLFQLSALYFTLYALLMKIIAHDLVLHKKIPAGNILYLNFEDERFVEFSYKDFNALYESYLELNNPEGKTYLFFD